jgi:hypothetical protein
MPWSPFYFTGFVTLHFWARWFFFFDQETLTFDHCRSFTWYNFPSWLIYKTTRKCWQNGWLVWWQNRIKTVAQMWLVVSYRRLHWWSCRRLLFLRSELWFSSFSESDPCGVNGMTGFMKCAWGSLIRSDTTPNKRINSLHCNILSPYGCWSFF